jgi:hypothetical protein
VLKLLENVKPVDLISVDWCEACVGKLLREVSALVPLAGWMPASEFPDVLIEEDGGL